ncbi:MAG: alpha/beta hydrolase [Clostridia bacterium]|nr:alpha/beta hydrolase [Clostridia bacterium]
MGYFLLVLAVILLIFIILGLYVTTRIVHNKLKKDFNILEYRFLQHEPEYEEEVMNWIKSISLDYYNIVSPYFYKLNILEIKQNDKPEWIVLQHGVTMNHKFMLAYAYMYHQMGYNLILPDARRHGKSGGKTSSYGYYEKYDMRACIDHLRQKFGKNINIGMHGVSMGASIVLSYAAGVRDDCSFYIADCPYSSFKRQLKDVVKRVLKLPDFIINIIVFFGILFTRLLFGYDINKIDISAKIHRMENPALFTTCRGDKYIDYQMTVELYEKCRSECKKLVLFENGGHTEAYPANRREYIEMVSGFLGEIGFGN